MDIRLINSFLVLSEMLHFGRAAKFLNMTQPALSNQIALLERDLGGPLFDRSGRQIELTEAGRIFQKEARKLLSDAEDLRFRLQSLLNGKEGVLSVGYGDVTEIKRLARAFLRMQTDFPNIRLRVQELIPGETVEGVQSGKLDIAIITGTADSLFPPDLTGVPIMTGPVKLAIPSHHPLASAKRITPNALRRCNFIMRSKDETDETADMKLALDQWWDNYFGDEKPNIIFWVRRRSTAFWLVGAGLGISLLPHPCELIPAIAPDLYTAVTNVTFRTLPELDIQSCTYIVMRKNRCNAALNNFMQCVQKTFNTRES